MKSFVNRWYVAAAIGLATGCALGVVLPWPVAKVVAGLGVLVVVVCGLLGYMRHESRKSAATKTEAKAES